MSSLLLRICRLSKTALRLVRPQRGWLTFLVFLVLAGIFWLSTALNESYDCEADIPVVVEHVPKNVILTDNTGDTVHVKVNDKGFALMQYLYGDKLRPITLDFSTFSRQSDKCVVSATELQRLVAKRLFSSSSIISMNPERLEYVYVTGVSKEVPVRILGTITPARNYYLAHTQISPTQVTVYAPKEKADSIKYVLTEKLVAENFSETLQQTVALQDIGGCRLSPHEVTVTFYPDVLTEETVEVPITTVNVPDGVTLRTFPAKAKVTFTVGVSDYRSVNTSQFLVEADYTKITDSDKCPLRLARTPHGITKASLAVSEVDYLIEN